MILLLLCINVIVMFVAYHVWQHVKLMQGFISTMCNCIDVECMFEDTDAIRRHTKQIRLYLGEKDKAKGQTT